MKKVLLFLFAITMVSFSTTAETVVVATDDCAGATDISSLFGGSIGMSMNSAMYNNVGATASATEIALAGYECFAENDGVMFTPSLENAQWVSFVGDGGLYQITTNDCGGTVTDYIDGGDTQLVLYSGADCSNLAPLACDEDASNVNFAGAITFQTVMGTQYYLLIDGYDGSDGEYCVQVTQISLSTNVDCANSANIDNLLMGAIDETISTPIQSNFGVGTDAGDPAADIVQCFAEQGGGVLNNTVWYRFTGDGGLYSILTTNCNGAVVDWIDNGDTQLSIFTGSCGDFTQVACNDDVAGTPPGGPFPSGLNFQTDNGVQYYMMIDGFGTSDGEFCIEFTETGTLDCNSITIGDASTDKPNVCLNDTTSFNLVGTTVVIEEGTSTKGFRWVVSSADISGSANPFDEMSYQGAFGEAPTSADVYTPILINDGAQLPAGTYFFTPVTYAGGIGAIPNADFSSGCVVTGTSVEINLLGAIPAITATSSSEEEITPPGNNGTASVTATGGSDDNYTYLWSNGETTDSISGLAAGTYMVTITDATGCTETVVEVVVDNIVSVSELEFQRAIQVQPNPAQQQTSIQYNFSESLDLQVTLTNTLGQVLSNRIVGGAQNGTIDLNLANYSNGVYFINLTDGTHQVTRRLVVSK